MAPSSPDSSPPDPAEVVESRQNLSINSPEKTPDGSDPVTEANIVEELPEVTANPHGMLVPAIQLQPYSYFYMPTSYHNEGYGGHSNHETALMLHGSHYTYPYGYYVPHMIYTPPASPGSSMGNEVHPYQHLAQYYNPSDQPRNKSNSDEEDKVSQLLSGTDSEFCSTVPHTNFPQTRKAKTAGDEWSAADVKKGQDHGRGAFRNSKRTTDIMREIRRGPRTKRGNPKGGEITAETNDFPNQKKFDGESFSEEYSCAKFFVIKSYSEDDVHKSIKYGFWASTHNGNKKLDVAFQDAKQNMGGCPVFLFFSVNASGKFVGFAEMVGPVDFDKTLEYWQNDRWQGSIPVKWHIIKDVDNRSLMHIKLKNNRNRSVTKSRDTQEVEFEQGMEMIKIFKSKPLTTSMITVRG